MQLRLSALCALICVLLVAAACAEATNQRERPQSRSPAEDQGQSTQSGVEQSVTSLETRAKEQATAPDSQTSATSRERVSAASEASDQSEGTDRQVESEAEDTDAEQDGQATKLIAESDEESQAQASGHVPVDPAEVIGQPDPAALEQITLAVMQRPDRSFSSCGELEDFYRLTMAQVVAEEDIRRGAFIIDHLPFNSFFTTSSGTVSPAGTILRVEGVEEGTFAKIYGDMLFLVTHVPSLIAAKVNEAGEMTIVGEIELDIPERVLLDDPERRSEQVGLFLHGGKALVVRQFHGSWPAKHGQIGPIVRVTEIDVSQPERARVLRVLDLPDSSLLSSWQVGGEVRLLLRSRDDVRLRLLRGQLLGDQGEWIRQPEFVLRDHKSGERQAGPAVPCEATHLVAARQGVFYPAGTPIVEGFGYAMTLDAEEGVSHWNSRMLLGGIAHSYMTDRLMLVASSDYWSTNIGDEVHRFNFPGGGEIVYCGSGTIEGSVFDDWALHIDNDRAYIWGSTGVVVAAEFYGPLHAFDLSGWCEAKEASTPIMQETYGPLIFIGPYAYAVVWGSEPAEIKTITLADLTVRTDVGNPALTGAQQHAHPLGDRQLLSVGSARVVAGDVESYVGRVTLAGRRADGSLSALHRLDYDGVLLNLSGRFYWHDDVAWFLAYANGGYALVGVRVEEDRVALKAEILDAGFGRPTVFGGQLHLLSRDSIRSYSLVDHALLSEVMLVSNE